MFGPPPCLDFEFRKLVQQSRIEDEESLPTVIDELNDNDASNNTEMDLINGMDDIDTDVISFVRQLSDDIASNGLNDMSSRQTVHNRHDLIRKTATDNYLATAHEKMKTSRQHY